MKPRLAHFTFDPGKKGLRRILGELEAEIMEVVWDHREVTVRQVHEKLERKREIAYTTVMTVMSRLAEKGILQRARDGIAFVYRPVHSREEFLRSSVRTILSELLRDFSSPVIHQFVEAVEKSRPERMEELARLVESKRKKKNV